MPNMENVEPVVSQPDPTDSVPSTTKLTKPEAVDGGDGTVQEWEYEFSTCSNGRVMFIGIWDKTDLSACERLMHRPLKLEEITYSKTGNGFVVDRFGNHYTFKKAPIQRSFEWPDFGAQKAEKPELVTPPKVARLMSVEELLAGL